MPAASYFPLLVLSLEKKKKFVPFCQIMGDDRAGKSMF
jgi:hypothetical protein